MRKGITEKDIQEAEAARTARNWKQLRAIILGNKGKSGVMTLKDMLPLSKGRRPVGKATSQFYAMISKDRPDLRLVKSWPDYALISPEGKLSAVQIKARRGRGLKREQRAVMKALVAHGVQCYVWTPDDGFMPFSSPEIYRKLPD